MNTGAIIRSNDTRRFVPLRYATECLDGKRIPLNSEQRAQKQGEYPYWGANGVLDSVDEFLFDEPLVLLGEDGAPFFDKTKPVSFFVIGKIWVNNHMHVLRVRGEMDPRFVSYCLNAVDYGPWIEGSTRDKLTQEKMGSILLPKPPLNVQVELASYLDRETSRIDALIAAKERLIELLAEKRRALITQAVTKGLNPNAPMRDSGLTWLGEIPRHWEVKKLKYLGQIYYGLGQPPEYFPEGAPFLRATNVSKGKIVPEGLVYIDEREVAGTKAIKLVAGDLIVVRSGAYTGDSAIVTEEWEGSIAGYDLVVRFSHVVIPKFVGYAMLSSYVLETQIIPLRSRAAQPHLNAEELGEIAFVLPPTQEQEAIVLALGQEITNIETLEAATKRTVDLLRERRSALIAAAVTGRLIVESKPEKGRS